MSYDPAAAIPGDECRMERLDALLDDSLGIQEESELIEHLEHCRACQLLLDARAAEPATWSDAEQFLTDELYDEFSVSRIESEQPADPIAAQIHHVLQVLDPTDHPNSLGRLGPYEITGVIGSGGMGIVLKGMDPSLDRIVAIKVLAPHLASSGAARQRFGREAKAAAAVLHPNVIAIHSVANEVALPYLVMPYLRGCSLQRRIDQDGPLDPVDVLRIGVQVASGLAAAHAHGLVHRDIKPANILLEDGVERVTITDFGLARAVDDASMTRSGVIAGTPQYMSPEQARGEVIDCRSDLFSLGSAMYTMCTGHSPFRAETSFGVLRRITDEEPRPIREINPAIPRWLCCLISQLQAKDRMQRISTAEEVELICRGCLTHLEQPDSHSIPDCLLEDEPTKRAWGKFAAAGAIVLASLSAVALVPPLVDSFKRLSASSSGQSTTEDSSMLEVRDSTPVDMRSPETLSPETLSSESRSAESGWDDDVGLSLGELASSLRQLDEESKTPFGPGTESGRTESRMAAEVSPSTDKSPSDNLSTDKSPANQHSIPSNTDASRPTGPSNKKKALTESL